MPSGFGRPSLWAEAAYLFRWRGLLKSRRPEEVPVDDPNAEPDSDDEVPEKEDWKPTAELLTDLELAHDSSGQPNNRDFARLLRRGNARAEVARWVPRFSKCDECEAHEKTE